MKTFTLSLSLLFTVICFGQNQHTILWRVTQPGNEHVSYLLGTYHTFGNTFVESFPAIIITMMSCDVVATESELDKAKATAYYNSLPSSDQLELSVSKEDYAFIDSVFKKSGVDVTR